MLVVDGDIGEEPLEIDSLLVVGADQVTCRLARDRQHRLAVQGSVTEMLAQATAAAELGMQATIPMQARKGRASYLGERSIGHQDPGATSMYLLLRDAARTWGDTGDVR